MRTLAHLSDLHFGAEEPVMISALRRQLLASTPHLLVISGDLTQRGRSSQFKAAREFITSLPFSLVVVPGNHDVAPWYKPLHRLFNGLRNYRRYIGAGTASRYEDDEIIVVGINTARSLTSKGGRINQRQIEEACLLMGRGPQDAVRIVVTHHPFDVPPGGDERDIVGRARMAMARFAECRADVFLSGHLHVTHVCQTARRYRIEGHSALVVQAGTAVSHRRRGELNAWNLLHVEKQRIAIERFEWREESSTFGVAVTEQFERFADGWVPLRLQI